MDDITKFVIDYLDQDIARCEDFRDQKIKPDVLERYKKFFAETSYFEAKFPKLAKQSSLVSHDVMSTIDGAMPPIMKILMGSDEVIKIEGAESEDTGKAEIMEKLINYQLMRKNDMFNIMYDWVKDSLITGMGIVKCYWERETKDQQVTETMSIDALNQAYEAGLQIVEVVPADEFGNFDVTFIQQFYTKNQPRIENVMLSEFLFDPEARSIDECSFIAQKKRVTASYLREKEKQGLYANVEEAIKQGDEDVNVDEIEEEVTELDISAYGYQDNARKKKIIYECFVDIDINEDGILEKMIITKCGKTILRMEPNVYGRHPFFEMIPVKEPFRVWPKQSFVDRVAQWQDLKTAMIKQMAVNIALSNDPRVVVDEQSINLSDLIEGRNWLRKKSGATMADAVMPMPPIPLSTATFPMLEYADTQKEQDTGVTRYNQGLDARSLNKTASGINSIMNASNQRMELMVRRMAETGIRKLFRFMITLNQKFIDVDTVIRLTNETLNISPEDLSGEFDLVVNAGMGITSKESTMMSLQTLLTALLQVGAQGIPVATPTNIYNIFKKWVETVGFKDTNTYITDPAIQQQRMMMEQAIKTQVLMSLPPEIMAYYYQNATLPPEILMSMPPQIQVLFGGNYGQQGAMAGGGTPGGTGGGSVGVAQGLPAFGTSGDNRTLQNYANLNDGGTIGTANRTQPIGQVSQ